MNQNKHSKINILFVCTGNIFRSASAELLLKKYLKEQNISCMRVSSAGITAHKQSPITCVKKELLKLGVDITKHVQRKLTQKIADSADIIVVMTNKQKQYIKEKFKKNSILFNKICFSKDTDLYDETEKGYKNKRPQIFVNKYMLKTLYKIDKGVKKLIPIIINHSCLNTKKQQLGDC
jgi:protein-tyrosine-phosphatase